MKINAICMVKNEGDVVEETLLNAMKYCHRIYIFDNGSTDQTWDVVSSMAARFKQIEIAFRSDEPFTNQLRNRVYNKYHHLYSDKDWWYILDADEMLSESPVPLLERAEKAGKSCVKSWFAQFYFTDSDLASYENEDKTLPIALRRKHYQVNWKEWRYFKNDPMKRWPEHTSDRVPYFSNKVFGESTVIRHYAHRTPEQLEKRNQIRVNDPESFVHVTSKKHIASWVKPADGLRVYHNDGRFTISLNDKFGYYTKEVKFWLGWRWQNVKTLAYKGLSSIQGVTQAHQ